MARPLLTTKGLSMHFGGVRAVDSVNLDVHENEIVALIGPNGAGKTTFFNCLSGLYHPTAGEILLQSGDKTKHLSGLKPNQVTIEGLARTFQNIRLFQNMTVLENVLIGRHCRTQSFILGAILRGAQTRKEERQSIGHSFSLLKQIGLADYADELAKNLPYGAQRRLEMARALATEPKMLLLDEPAAGMNPKETSELIALVQHIREQGMTILLIEHDMKMVMRVSDRIYVMDYGRQIAEGTPQEVRKNPAVIQAYLGEANA